MALNKEVFRTRALTAVIFAAVMLAGLFLNFISFLLLFSIIHFGCWFEYMRLVEKITNDKVDIVIRYFFAICGFVLMLIIGIPHIRYDGGLILFGKVYINLKWILWLTMLIFLAAVAFQNKQISTKTKFLFFAGFIYISIPLSLMVNIRDHFEFVSYYGEMICRLIPFSIILSIWINDTMAYIVGSLIGKTPFSKISPKKTWEGIIGGLVFTMLIMGLLAYYVDAAKQVHLRDWIMIGEICAITGTIGDLFESKLKRMAGVKDSGSFMPGHGGFLDRFDSLLWAIPFAWLYLQFFGR